MSLFSIVRRALVVIAFVWPASSLLAQTPQPGAEAKTDSIAGQFLVATPDIGDPRFDRTVILIIHHDQDGAFGVVINRPIAVHPIAEILDWIGEPHEGIEGQVRVFAGGPVQEHIGFILHSDEYRRPETLAVGTGVAVTSSAAILRDMGHGHGPKKALVAFGYAGWMPGQLEAELDQHAWALVPLDPALIFDTDPEKIWDMAWARRTISL